jgi:elongation factor P hydroxylase
MKINELYEIIRKEGVCLWVGSACSMYAGFPNVTSLKTILNEQFRTKHHEALDESKSLREFTEDYVTLSSREDLVSKLQEIFLKTPKATSFHDQLAKIPYFNTVITTNYDKLLEGSFRGATVVTADTDVARITKNKTVIYKIHGDIDNDSSIIITNSDYVVMHNRQFKNPMWASIIHEISSQNILFFGYGYEDDNVKADFEYVYEKLGSHQKRRFMIGRSSSELKQKKLRQQNIDYVVCDAAKFVSGFIKHLKLNIVSDANRGWISKDAAQRFIQSFNKKTIVSSSIAGIEDIQITKLNGISNQKLRFQSTDQQIIESYKEFENNYDIKEFSFKREHLNKFSHVMEGFNVSDLGQLEELKLFKLPSKSGICNIEFTEFPDFELIDIKYKVFSAIVGKSRFIAELHGFQVQLDLLYKEQKQGIDLQFKLTEPVKPQKIKHYCDVFQAVVWFLSGKSFNIITPSGYQSEHNIPEISDLKQYQYLLTFYNMVREIEKFFRVKFPGINFQNISLEERKRVQSLYSLIINKYVIVMKPDAQLTIDLPEDKHIANKVLEGVKPNTYLVMEKNQIQVSVLFGVTLELGTEQIAVLEPRVKSYDEKKKSAVLVPKDMKIVHRYSKIGFDKMEPIEVLWRVDN